MLVRFDMLSGKNQGGRISNGLLLFAIYFVSLFFLTMPSSAWAKTGIRLLDEPAIAVKAPDRVFLVAIARAENRMVAVGAHGVIVYSDDNGKTWKQASVPVDVTLTAVGFANAQDGWAIGHDGVILNTSDGGVTWHMQLNGIELDQMTLAAAQAAVAQNDPSVGTAHAMARAEHFVQTGPAQPFLSILVQDSNNVTVFGAYRVVVKTTDGGKTWADWSLHIGDPLSNHIYDVAPVGQDLYLAGEAGLVFRSTDGGASFPEVTSPSPNTLFIIGPSGDGGVFVGGVAGAIFRSNDNGNTWANVDLATSQNLTSDVVLSSGLIIVGGEAGFLFASNDHAQSFRPLPEVQHQAVFGLAEAPNGDLVVVGSGGVSIVPAADLNGIVKE